MQRLKNAIYHLVSRLSRTSKEYIQQGTLLIIKTDEIGDYVLWRNVLPCIRKSAAFKNYRIALLGNPAWKEIATSLDDSFVDEFIWLDKKKFKSDMRYRLRFLRSVRAKGFEKVLNPIFSRSPRVDDAIVAVCSTSYKIGMVRNDHNVSSFEKGYDEGLYNEVHELPLTGLFEFERNLLFTSVVLKESCSVEFGFHNSVLPDSPVAGDYAVIFPGSGRADRRWSAANFAEVAKHLHNQNGLNLVLAGGPGDKDACAQVSSLLDFPVTDLSGKTSLTSFISLLRNAKLLLSVDTGSVHLAAAAGCTVFGIFSGSQYGRFAPYPGDILKKPFHAVYPPEFEKELSSLPDLNEKYQYDSPYMFDSIEPQKVISKIVQ